MDYNSQLKAFQERLSELSDERDRLDGEMASLLEIIEVVARLANEEGEDPIVPKLQVPDAGFTDKVRAILKANPGRIFTPIQIRNVFLEENPKQDRKVVLIHAHNPLKRLAAQDEIVEVPTPDGRTGYKWKQL